jgi:Caspase domain
MIRAGVFIGVDKTGDLQRLNDAAAGARRMHGWALDQGMTDLTHAKLITDADGQTVAPERIYDAIKELIDDPGVDQLVLYFAGHGVNINRGEQWLLTEAPVRASAAVNVAGSVELARYCGIQHVVVISDACRTAPEGIQAQNVRGLDVFPNEAASDRAKPVDLFFACFLGRTAAELKDPAVVAGNYTALYTSALLEALSGAHPDLLERATTPGDSSSYIRPRRLQSYLEQEIPRRVRAMRLQQKVNQNPDAIITSDESRLSRVEAPAGPRGRPMPEAHPPASPSLRSVTGRLVRSAVAGDPAVLDRELAQARTTPVAGAEQLARTVDRIATPFGPGRVEDPVRHQGPRRPHRGLPYAARHRRSAHARG